MGIILYVIFLIFCIFAGFNGLPIMFIFPVITIVIIVPDGKNYDDSAIEALTEFQEQYFEHVIIR